nr:hypothetical protein [Tanacetum cinerariifolium]
RRAPVCAARGDKRDFLRPQAARRAAYPDARRRGRPHHAALRQWHGHGAARRGARRPARQPVPARAAAAAGPGSRLRPGVAAHFQGEAASGAGGAAPVWRAGAERAG